MPKLRTKSERDQILQSIYEVYPTKLIELDFSTPFQLLTAVMLSAQMTDKGVNKATKKLFEMVKTPADLLKLKPEKVETMLRGVNYYRVKTKHLFMTAEKLIEDDESRRKLSENLPDIIEYFTSGISELKHGNTEALKYLQTLPGVGIKTAKVVLSHLYDLPFIGVDTHIHRVMNRMNIVKTKTPNETDLKLDKLLSDEQKRTLHHSIVLFGRYVCTAKKCHCPETKLKEWCQCEECRRIKK